MKSKIVCFVGVCVSAWLCFVANVPMMIRVLNASGEGDVLTTISAIFAVKVFFVTMYIETKYIGMASMTWTN